MDPLDFLNVADSLRNSGQESERRTSVGRSYFALFNHLRLKLEPIKQMPTTDETRLTRLSCTTSLRPITAT